MTKSILEELQTKVILSLKNITDIKEYIALKFAFSSSNEKADIFSDALIRVIDERIPSLENPYRSSLRNNLIKYIANSNPRPINSADVFLESVRLDLTSEILISVLSPWARKAASLEIDQRDIFPLIQRIKVLIESGPELSNNNILERIVLDDSSILDNLYISENEECLLVSGLSTSDPDMEKEIYEKELITDINNTSELGFNAAKKDKDIILVNPLSRGICVIRQALQQSIRKGSILSVGAAIVFSLVIWPAGIGQSIGLEKSGKVIKKVDSINSNQKPVSIQNISRRAKEKLNMRATAYDLSMGCCGKPRNHPQYGITFSGKKAQKGRTVAVDTSVIPLGSKLYITFPKSYSYLNGVYIAEDTGNKVKMDIIDIYFGEDKTGETIVHNKALNFGVQKISVYIL